MRCLVHLYSASAFMSALAALRTLHPSGGVRATFVLYLPSASAQTHAAMGAIVEAFAVGLPEAERVLVLEPQALQGLSSRWSAARSARNLVERLGSGFDEILYQHDTSGVLYQLAALAYPQARRVCIGDAFGMVYRADFIESYFRVPQKQGFPGRARRLVRRLRTLARIGPRALESSHPAPHLAALVLPVDPAGNYLTKVPLQVCKRETFLKVVADCAKAVPALADYIGQMLAAHRTRRRYLFVTEHFAEVGQLALEREVEMYCAIIERHCEPGSVVYLKRHPAERLPKGERIREKLSGRWEIVLLDAQWMRYPLEVWEEMVRECQTICMAYPVLSLRYIYAVEVMQPMNDAFIERWFEPTQWKWTKDSLRLYVEPARRLAEWDGRGVLWSPAAV